MDLEKKFVQVDGARIAYVDIGEGKPTLLIQGGGPGASGISNYRRNIDYLSKGRRLIIPDLPGYGESEDKLGFNELYKDLGAFLIHFMDALGIDKADCVGNSLGGITTVGALLHDSSRIDKAVLMGPGGFQPVFTPMPTEGMRRMGVVLASDNPTREQMRGVIECLVHDSSFITDELLDERVKATSNPGRFRPFAHPFGEVWRENLGSITNPILVMWGAEDRVCPVDMAPGIIKAFPNADLHIFANCGHWVQWEMHEKFDRMVADFFDN